MNKLLLLVALHAFTVRLMALDPAAGHMVEALPPRDIGQEVYDKHCVGCHGADLHGVVDAPLDADLLKRYEIKTLIQKLQKGCVGTPPHSYGHLKIYELVKVTRHIIKMPSAKR
jgi:mono/diheme cytochrome c family protein